MKCKLFDIVLHSPMGPKKGTLKLFEEGEALSGIITILGCENSFSGSTVKGQHYTFFVKLKTPAGDVPCSVTAEIRDKTLIAVADTSKGIMYLTGEAPQV
ncbi:MAG: hypothetical protein VB106_09235 [Clostridiaceae bacterium]|jgi:hypothetical protein|nr:hypothetical protein [Clostridiaceae bacterium]